MRSTSGCRRRRNRWSLCAGRGCEGLEKSVDDELPIGRVLGLHRGHQASARRKARPCRSSAPKATSLSSSALQAKRALACRRCCSKRVGGAAVSCRAGRSSRGTADNTGAAGFGEAPAAVPADVENGSKAAVAIAAEQHRHAIFFVGERATVWQPVSVPDENGCEGRNRRSTSAWRSQGLKWLSTAMRFTAAATLPLGTAGDSLSADALEPRSGVGRKVHDGV